MKKTRIVIVIALLVLVLVVAAYAAFFLIERGERRKMEREYPVAYTEEIQTCAAEYALDPYLVLAIMRCESSFKSDAVSSVGAIGLMQIMPDTGTWIAHKLGLDAVYNEQMLYDPACSVRFGCWFLRFLTDRFEGELPHIIAAYNAGHGSVEKWLDDPAYSQNGILTAIPYPETERYVEKVQTALEAYRTLYPDLFTDGLIESPDEA